MDHYILQPEEVVLFENSIFISESKATNHLILTNINIVVVSTTKKMFRAEEVSVTTYPVESVKIYNDTPQVSQKNGTVTIFMTSGELKFSLGSTRDATKFVNQMVSLITGKSAAERGAGKVKSAIGLVDNTLGINTTGAIAGVLENGLVKTIFKGIGDKKTHKTKEQTSVAVKITETANAATSVAQAVSGLQGTAAEQRAQQDKVPYEERIEQVKKLKELVDMNIITQEEFEAKKKELLEL